MELRKKQSPGSRAEPLESRRLLSAGDADATFGAAGKVLTDLPGGVFATLSAATLQADGKLVVAGRLYRPLDGEGDFFVARYAAGNSGSLDPTFGQGGWVAIDFDRGDDAANAVALGPGGKIVVVGSTGGVQPTPTPPRPSLLPSDFAAARLNADGSPDRSFDGDGRKTIDFGNTGSTDRAAAWDVAVRTDGGMVIAGGVNFDAALAVLRPGGAFETGFDGVGTLITNFGAAQMVRANAVLIDANGSIVVAGTRANSLGADNQAPIGRLLPSGAFDPDFGTGGATLVTIGVNGFVDLVPAFGGKIMAIGGNFTASRLTTAGRLDTIYGGGDGIASGAGFGTAAAAAAGAMLDNGSVVIGGHAIAGPGVPGGPVVVKFDPNGAPDGNFGSGGRASAGAGWVGDFIPGPAGSLVTAGYLPEGAASPARPVLTRFLPNGQLDAAFAAGGQATTDVVGPSWQAVVDTVPMPGGGAVALALHYSGAGSGYDWALLRYAADGTLDRSFADGHTVAFLDGQNRADVPTALALDPEGRIIAAGRSGNDAVIARYNANGTPDATFGDGGRVVIGAIEGLPLTPVPTRSNAVPALVQPVSLAVQRDGRIVVAATAGAAGGEKFALLRLTSQGQPDSAFGGGDGSAVVNSPTTGIAAAVALGPSGKIVVAGTRAADVQSTGTISVARFTPAGSPDTSFYNGSAVMPAPAAGAATAVAVGADGAITVGGWTAAAGTPMPHTDFLAIRLVAQGLPDLSFGGDGVATADFGGRDDQARDLALLPDGSVLLAGGSPMRLTMDVRTGGDFALARFTPAGEPDPAFGANDGAADGKLTIDLAGMGDAASSVAIDEQGRILVAGGAYAPGRSGDMAVVRLEGSGATGPAVLGLAAHSASWTGAFRSALASAGFGDGAGFLVQRLQRSDPLLPWVNLDRVTIQFAGSPGAVSRDWLRVRGVNVASYDVAGLDYDPATGVATWRLAQPVENDKVVVELSTDADAEPELSWRFNVLGGDVTGDGVVNSTDLADLRRRVNKSLASPGTGTSAYGLFADPTGDGRINALDMAAVKQRLNRRLPTGNPAALGGISLTDEMFGAAPILA